MFYILVFKFLGPLVDKISQDFYRHFTRSVLSRAGIAFNGLPLWISPQTYFDRGGGGKITLGNRCVISQGVKLLTHDYSLDRYFERLNGESEHEVFMEDSIIISEQSFIGMGALIMPGVNIGEGSIVGAGSVVTRSVPPDTVVAGCPARTIGLTKDLWERKGKMYKKQLRRP